MDTRIVKEGLRLRSDLLFEYQDKYLDNEIRALIHAPDNGAWKYGFQSWKRILDMDGNKNRHILQDYFGS